MGLIEPRRARLTGDCGWHSVGRMSDHSPEPDEPDDPPEVVGALTLDDFKWLHKIALLTRIPATPLILVFSVGAVLVGAWWIKQLLGALGLGLSPVVMLEGVFSLVSPFLIVLTPAALLRRDPTVLRTRTALLCGLAILALEQFLIAAGQFATIDASPTSPVGNVILGSLPFLAPVGGAMIAYGLLVMRIERPRSSLLLVGILAVYVALDLRPMLIAASQPLFQPQINWWSLAAAVTSAFAVWVAVDAWLRKEPPEPFWLLLGAAFPLRVLAAVWLVPQDVALIVSHTNLPDAVDVAATATIVLPVLLAFVAYLRYAPLAPVKATSDDQADDEVDQAPGG
jgi:hypothetical protein